jgi:gas vesicle protein
MRNKSTYYLMGFGCGSLAGLLFAPKAGAATRAGIVKAGRRRRRMVKQKISSVAAAIEDYRTGALRALKRRMPLKRVRALFQ